MAQLYDILKQQSKYWDKKNFPTQQAYNTALNNSSTVYVGNLSFYTPQDSIKQLFSRVGNVANIIMGIDNEGLPCGFCFVVYENKSQAELAVEYISRTKLGGRIIRVDLDPGYIEGREKGRGSSGLQRRDDFRNKQDPQRPRKKVHSNNQGNRESSAAPRDNNRDSYNRDRSRDYRSRDYQRNDNRRDYNQPNIQNKQKQRQRQRDSQY